MLLHTALFHSVRTVEQYSVMCMCTSFYPLICRSTSRALLGLDYCQSCCCEHWVLTSFKAEFSLNICRLLDHTATLVFIFWGTSILFSIVAARIYIPTHRVGGFQSQLSLRGCGLHLWMEESHVAKNVGMGWLSARNRVCHTILSTSLVYLPTLHTSQISQSFHEAE